MLTEKKKQFQFSKLSHSKRPLRQCGGELEEENIFFKEYRDCEVFMENRRNYEHPLAPRAEDETQTSGSARMFRTRVIKDIQDVKCSDWT